MVYISGAITGTHDYLFRFHEAEQALIKQGHTVINMARVCCGLPRLTHNQYMSVSLVLLAECDSIYMLKGWEHSKGAQQELLYAITNNIKIIMEK